MASIFVTGAGGGIGGTLVLQALARGDTVFAGVLNDTELAGLAPHPQLYPIVVDVGSTSSVAKAFAQIDTLLAGALLNHVVNCAAICPIDSIEVQSAETMERTLNINVVGSVRILRESLPRLRGHGGRILLFSSLWGKVGGPMLSAYCASKHAIEAVADSARRETLGQNLRIVVIEPGVIRTGMVSVQERDARAALSNLPESYRPVYQSLYEKYVGLIQRTAGGGTSVEDCSKKIAAVLAAPRPKARYRVGADATALTFLARILPDPGMDKLFKSLMKM